MKTKKIVQEEIVVLDIPSKIKEVIITQWDKFETKDALANHIEEGFIFGLYANNEHYQKSLIIDLINEVEISKTTIEESTLIEETESPVIKE